MKEHFSVSGMISALGLSAALSGAGLWLTGALPLWAKPTPPPSLSAVQSLSELATARVHISDTIEGSNEHFTGKWMLHGEVIIGVDLAGATYGRIDQKTRKAVLTLPPPRLISSKVDHERSEELYVKMISVFALSSSPKVLRDEVWKQADRKIQKLGEEQGYKERAKVQAERVLQSLFQGAGWTVDVKWQ